MPVVRVVKETHSLWLSFARIFFLTYLRLIHINSPLFCIHVLNLALRCRSQSGGAVFTLLTFSAGWPGFEKFLNIFGSAKLNSVQDFAQIPSVACRRMMKDYVNTNFHSVVGNLSKVKAAFTSALFCVD